MKRIIDYLTMFCSISVFWLVTAIMFITLVALYIAVPAALGLGIYQIFKDTLL